MSIALIPTLGVVLSLCLWSYGGSLDWYDQQRVAQVFIYFSAAVYLLLFRARPLVLGRSTWVVLFLVLVLGFVSSMRALYPVWALTEVALWLGFFAFVIFVESLVRRGFDGDAKIIILAVLLFCFLLLARIFLMHFLALVGREPFDSGLASVGFSHPRFFGQIGTLLIAILPAIALTHGASLSGWRYSSFVLAVFMWVAVIASGTRGTLMAISSLGFLMSFAGGPGRLWAVFQLGSSLLAVFAYWILFNVLPLAMDVPSSVATDVLWRAGMTGREQLWSQALEMIRDHPFLGVGPMHFAVHVNQVGSHPHQSVLQFASEWGVPVVLLMLWLGVRCFLPAVKDFRSSKQPLSLACALRFCLKLALMGAFIQSMVDGVMVVPYTQLWLSLLIGILLGLRPSPISEGPALYGVSPKILMPLFVLAATLLLHVVVRDLPLLQMRADAYLQSERDDHLRPRFWLQGVIGP